MNTPEPDSLRRLPPGCGSMKLQEAMNLSKHLSVHADRWEADRAANAALREEARTKDEGWFNSIIEVGILRRNNAALRERLEAEIQEKHELARMHANEYGNLRIANANAQMRRALADNDRLRELAQDLIDSLSREAFTTAEGNNARDLCDFLELRSALASLPPESIPLSPDGPTDHLGETGYTKPGIDADLRDGKHITEPLSAREIIAAIEADTEPDDQYDKGPCWAGGNIAGPG